MKLLIFTLSSMLLFSCYYKEDNEIVLDYNPFDHDYTGESPFVMDATTFFVDTVIIDEVEFYFPKALHKFHINTELFPQPNLTYGVFIDNETHQDFNEVFQLQGYDHTFEVVYLSASVGQEYCADYSLVYDDIPGVSYNYCYVVEE